MNGDFEDPFNQDSAYKGRYFHWSFLEDYAEQAQWAHIYRDSSDIFENTKVLGKGEVVPFSGMSFAGLGVFDPEFEFRDYLVGTLKTPLIAGTRYKISFAIKPAYCNGFLINSFGSALINSSALPSLVKRRYTVLKEITPNLQFSLTTQSVDRWLLLEGSFTAKGGEDKIILGCYSQDKEVKATRLKHSKNCSDADQTICRSGYYLLDNIKLTASW
ncbi:hypothetical protein GCM10023229_06980 [Flavisolibacter ginsenosidimutans]